MYYVIKMIIDKIENASLYFGINKRIKTALDYIQNTNFLKAQLGKHEIEGDNIYALVYNYETKNSQGAFLEAHRNYIDVQYIFDGTEQVGFTSLDGQDAVKEYDVKDDYLIYKEENSLISFKKGMFAIFFPDDLHMPGISMGAPSKVKKVVVKVKIK